MDKSLLKYLTTDEIPFMLEKACLFGGKVTTPTPSNHKTIYIQKLEINKNQMFLKLPEEIEIERERSIVMKLNYRCMTFKMEPKDFIIKDKSLICRFPENATAIDIRDSERYLFPLNSHFPSTIYRIEKRAGSFETISHLIDVSKNGLGIVINDTEEGQFLKNDHLWVRDLNGMKLKRPLFGTIVYAFERKFRDGRIDTKMGISLSEPIPDSIFQELKNVSTLILTA